MYDIDPCERPDEPEEECDPEAGKACVQENAGRLAQGLLAYTSDSDRGTICG